MPSINPTILVWARETAGLTQEEAVEKLGIKDARGVPAVERLAALEAGEEIPRPMLVKMAKHYRRSLLTFYLPVPPQKGDRGQDFRTLPSGHSKTADALLDALIRDVLARQHLVRSAIEDEEERKPLPFIGSASMSDGVAKVLSSIQSAIGADLSAFRSQSSVTSAFAYLRDKVEAAGIFVVLIGNLGSHHTAIDLKTFRGFALADPIAPFVIINDQDAKTAWSFTLLHELAHLWLGTTGVSNTFSELAIEKFCNDVAGEYLLPSGELAGLQVTDGTNFDVALERIGEFAKTRHLSRRMVAYKLQRKDVISYSTWQRLDNALYSQWLEYKNRKDDNKSKEGGPNYYVVRRHRLGQALLEVVNRTLNEGTLTPTKAGKVLGVKARSVKPLLSGLPSWHGAPLEGNS